MSLKGFSILLISILAPIQSFSAPSKIELPVSMYLKGDTDKAVAKMNEISDKDLNQKEQAQKYFALGTWDIDKKDYKGAREALSKSIELKTPQKVHANFLIASAYKSEGDFANASTYYTKALVDQPPMNVFFQARIDMADMAINQKQFAKAADNLNYVERRQRGDYRYPEIVWRLIGVEMARGRRWQACRWARKMYASFPGHPLASEWGIDLNLDKYNGEATGCITTMKEMRQRIKRLLMAGADEKAKSEIATLIARVKKTSLYEIDVMQAEFLESQGFADEALATLVKYYDQQKSSFNYLMLLAKVAARAGEYQTAVGAYARGFQMSPRSKLGKKSLFSAAFLSYQIQDYDGATRKFQDFIRRFGSSGLSRDAQWHLAWIKYLKGDYQGAENGMSKLLVEYRGRGRRRRMIRDERARYWLAMTELKRENWGGARELFSQMSKGGSESYYGLLAKYRLTQIPDGPLRREITSSKKNAVEPLIAQLALPSTPIPEPLDATEAPSSGEVSEENESEETLAAGADDEEETPTSEADAPDVKDPAVAGQESIIIPQFKQAKMQERFDRANSLIQVGQLDWARWELYEVERRTSSKVHLKPLMDAYAKIGSYARSSYIAEIYFGFERSKTNIEDKSNRQYWEATYPRAYRDSVERYASKYGVDSAFIWAIMRAESHYNKDAASPVGARGLMQIMPYTASKVAGLLNETGYKDDMLLDPDTNIRWGTRYLSRLQKKFSNEIPLVAGGYNAGPHRVFSWLSSFGSRDMDEFIEHVPFVETRNYMKKVVKNYAVYKSLYSDAKASLAFLTQAIPVKAEGKQSPRENWEILD